MSGIPASFVSVSMRMDVPRKPVCRQLPWSSKFFRSAAFVAATASDFSRMPSLSAKSAGVCMSRKSGISWPSGATKSFRR